MLGTWDQNHMKVFDWQKAKAILDVMGVRDAMAGIMEDMERTASAIMEDGKPVKTEAWLCSAWGTPALVVGNSLIPCWRPAHEGEDVVLSMRAGWGEEPSISIASLAACPDRLLSWIA